jgi:hypothetical protein
MPPDDHIDKACDALMDKWMENDPFMRAQLQLQRTLLSRQSSGGAAPVMPASLPPPEQPPVIGRFERMAEATQLAPKIEEPQLAPKIEVAMVSLKRSYDTMVDMEYGMDERISGFSSAMSHMRSAVVENLELDADLAKTKATRLAEIEALRHVGEVDLNAQKVENMCKMAEINEANMRKMAEINEANMRKRAEINEANTLREEKQTERDQLTDKINIINNNISFKLKKFAADVMAGKNVSESALNRSVTALNMNVAALQARADELKLKRRVLNEYLIGNSA